MTVPGLWLTCPMTNSPLGVGYGFVEVAEPFKRLDLEVETRAYCLIGLSMANDTQQSQCGERQAFSGVG